MKFLFFLFFAAFALLVDWYAYQAIKTVFKNKKSVLRKIINFFYWGFTTGILACFLLYFILGHENFPRSFRVVLGAVFFVPFLAKVFAILWLFGEDIARGITFALNKIISKDEARIPSRRKVVSQLALISAFIPFATLTYGILRNAYRYQFHRNKVMIPDLPDAFDGFTIIQLSDIHAGSFTKVNPIENAIDKINQLNPDLIVFTGDLVNDLAIEMEPYIDVFSRLKAKYGVYSVTGNHDYADYIYGKEDSEIKRKNFEAFKKVHERMGWNLLMDRNETIEINGSKLALIGVQNWGKSNYFPQYGDLKKAFAGCEDCNVKVLLSHDPSHWDEEVLPLYPDIDLTLSGHTHGFQFGIESPLIKWSPSQFVYPRWAGLYSEGHQHLYVNRGFGFIGYPGRIGILPEVAVLQLSKA
jgi:uncharacterized protein